MALPHQCFRLSREYERRHANAKPGEVADECSDEIEQLERLIDAEIHTSIGAKEIVKTTSTMKVNIPEDPLSKPIPMSRKVKVQCDQAFRKELVDLYRLYVRDQRAAERLLPILNAVTVDRNRDHQELMAHKAINRLAVYEFFTHSTDSYTRSMGWIGKGIAAVLNIPDSTQSRLSEFYISFGKPNGAETKLLADVEEIPVKQVRRGGEFIFLNLQEKLLTLSKSTGCKNIPRILGTQSAF